MPGTVYARISAVFQGAGPRLLPTLVVLLVAAGISGPLRAHPHVFIDGVTDVVFENGKIIGVRQHWTFDNVFSLLLIEDFDANKNRKFDKPEIEALRKGAFAAVREFGYFTHIRLDGKKIAVDRVSEFTASFAKGRISYSFFVPFAKPVDPKTTKVDLGTYDDTFYVSVTYDAIDPIRLAGAGSSGCHFKMYEDAENPIYFGMVVPRRAKILCAAG
ncbi:MAG: DUF1007 family protein [Alphaproteobacteria bacterium]|nr:DUF1007 family protein [Alphaproteobacteria bacterium]